MSQIPGELSVAINIHPAISPKLNPAVQDYNIVHLTKDPGTGQIDSKLELIVKDNAGHQSVTPKYMSPPLRRAKEDTLRSLITDYIVQLNTIISSNSAKLISSETIIPNNCNLNDQVVSNLSHRVKTPLTAITSGIQLMYNYEHNEFVGRILDYLMQSSVELTKFVNDIIDFYYINQGILELELENTSLEELITDVYEVYSSQMKEESIEFSYNIDTNCPVKFISDKKRLSQIFVNLINNSITALSLAESSNIITENKPYTKSIHISCSVIPFAKSSTTNNKSRIRVLIQDTGIGVNLATADTLFQPFYLNNTTDVCMDKDPASAPNPGFTANLENNSTIGLGLAITRMLLHKIGMGTIKFVNPSKPYTCAIQFDLDVMEPGPLTDNKSAIISKSVTDTQIILIDDNTKNLALLKQIICNIYKKQAKSSGVLNIQPFSNPIQAYKYISTGSYHGLILLDIKMAGMSGYDIIQELDTAGIACYYRFVILSALPKASILAKLQTMSLAPETKDNIIISGKPYNLTELESHIRWITGQDNYQTARYRHRVTAV